MLISPRFKQECTIKTIKAFIPLKPTAMLMLNLVWTEAKDFIEMKYIRPRMMEYWRGMCLGAGAGKVLNTFCGLVGVCC